MAAADSDQRQSFWTTMLQSFCICLGEPVIPETPMNKDCSSTTTSEGSIGDSDQMDDEKKAVCESVICEEPMQQARPSIVLEYDSAPLSAIPEEEEEDENEEPTSERGSSPSPPSLIKLKRSSRQWSSVSDLDSIKSSEMAHPKEFE